MKPLHHRLLAAVFLLLSTLPAPLRAAETPARETRQPAPSLPPDGKTLRNITYAKVDGQSLLLDLYLPAAKENEKFPLVIWIHGGAWRAGSKGQCPAVGMVRLGFAVASIDYRLAPKAHFPAQIYDCKAAVRFLRASAGQYHLDPARFGAWGASAGGHLAALLATSGNDKTLDGDVGDNADQSSAVQAACDWFGPTDMIQLAGALDQEEENRGILTDFFGGPVSKNLEKVRQANPITYIDKADPPVLIMHGDKDPVVPISQSRLLEKALRDAGVEVTFKVVPKTGHGGSGFGSAESRLLLVSFFTKHLKPGS